MYKLIRELRRRKVFRGAAIYLVAAWAVLQVVDVVGEAAGLPTWTMRVLLYVAAIGFPLALFFGWRYEFGDNGLVRTKAADAREDSIALTGKDYLGIAAMVLISVVAAWQIVPPLMQVESDTGSSQTDVLISENSIAVLPFAEIGQGADGFLADGLSETLTHMLGQVEGLAVTARTSSLVFKERTENIFNIARELRVAYVLEGSVQQSGSRVRIIARLIESENGTELWSANINKEVEDIFDVQDEISRDVVIALGKVMDLGGNAIDPQYQPVLEAYKELVLGVNAQRNDTVDGIAAAKVHFERALELDPNYALAYIKLGENIAKNPGLARTEMAEQVRPLIEKALELDPLSAEAHVGLSMIFRFEGQKDLVEPTLLKAIELNPSLVEAHLIYSSWLVGQQRLDVSLEHAEIAADLDRKNPDTLRRLASAYWNLARSEQAIAISKDIVRQFPEYPYAYQTLSRWYMQMGNPGRSLLYRKKLYDLDPENRARLWSLCEMYWQIWDFEENERCASAYLEKYPDDLEARKQFAAARDDFAEAIRLAREHVELEPWNLYRKIQWAFFTSLTRDHAAVLEILRDSNPELFVDEPTVNDFTQWPARMAAQGLIETGAVEQGMALLAIVEDHVMRSRKMQGGGWFSGIEDAQIYAIRGEKERALDALEVAIDNDWSFYSGSLSDNTDPHLDSIVDAPRFAELVDRLRAHMAEERAWYAANKDLPLD